MTLDPASSLIQEQTGQRLAAIRNLAGLKQRQIHDLFGVDQSQWSKWEKGKQLPNPLVMIKFARRAKTSLDLLYRGMPIGTHPTLLRLLRQAIPELLAEDPMSRDQDMDTALALYRNAILQGEDQ